MSLALVLAAVAAALPSQYTIPGDDVFPEGVSLSDLTREYYRAVTEHRLYYRALKGIVYAMPARPLVVFLGLYIVKGGVLEGRAGLTFSLLRTWYEFMIDCKRRELQRRSQQLPV